MKILIGWRVSEPCVRKRREDRSATRCKIAPGPLHFPSRLHIERGHRCMLTWALVAHRARGKWVGYMWLLGRIFYRVSSVTT